MFSHDPYGQIVIGDLRCDLAFFQRVEPDYVLPAGANAQLYEPGKHRLIYTEDNISPESTPWADGDRYIANEVAYQSLYENWVLYGKLAAPETEEEITPPWA